MNSFFGLPPAVGVFVYAIAIVGLITHLVSLALLLGFSSASSSSFGQSSGQSWKPDMTSDFIIEPMKEWWHLEHSIQLARSCFKHDQKAITSLRQEILDPNAFYWVILVNGGVKGFGGIKKTGVHSQVYECPWRIIHPEWRGKGIGDALMQTRLDEIKKRGGQVVLLSTPNPKLAEKFGFKLIATLKDTWAPYVMMLGAISPSTLNAEQ